MKRYFILFTILILGLLSAKTLSLNELIEAGMNNAYSVRQKEVLLKNADLSIKSAAWDFLPSADISANRSNRDGVYSNSGSLVISKSLMINDPTVFNYLQARMNKTIAKLDVLQARKEIAYSVYSSWLNLNQTKKEIAIQTENLAVLKKIKEQTILQNQLGQRTSFDVNQNEINVINAQLAIADLKNQLAGQRADLFNQLKLEDDGADIEDSQEVTTDLNLDFSETKTESFLIMKLKEDMYKTQLDKIQQKSGLLPSLVLSGRYDQHSTTNDILNPKNYEDSYTLSIGLSWSLWTPWTKGSDYARIKNSLMLKQWQYEEGIASQTLEQANLQREWNYLKETLNLNTLKSTQAKDNLRIAQEKYNLGALSLIELEQARVNSLDAELALNKITYQLQKKIQEWNLLNSRLVLNRY